MKTVQLPIAFLEQIRSSEYSSIWLRWICQYGEQVQDPFFMQKIIKNEAPISYEITNMEKAYELGKPFISMMVFSKAKKQSSKQLVKAEKMTDQAKKVLSYLNTKTGIEFGKKNPIPQLSPIIKILKTGYTVEDCITVIDKKYDEWKDTDFEQYLRPSTLFNEHKFENYLTQPIKRNGNRSTAESAAGHIETVGDAVAKAHDFIDRKTD